MVQSVLKLVNQLAPNGLKQEAFVSLCHNFQFQGFDERQVCAKLLCYLSVQLETNWAEPVVLDGTRLG